ncbi:MAG: SMC-Scp complex subunit ScpB [Christensenellales bacterium]|jgi:segregation and condensation protein B
MIGMELPRISAAVEAMLFVAGDPVAVGDLADVLEVDRSAVLAAVEALSKKYSEGDSGLLIRFVDDKVQLCTNPEWSEHVERLLQPVRSKNLSQAMLETLSIIAYKQPITRAEIEAIRGVRCEYAINQLLQAGLIDITGRKNTVGRPSLFGTTEKFLIHFGLSSLSELPRREEILNSQQQESFKLD